MLDSIADQMRAAAAQVPALVRQLTLDIATDVESLQGVDAAMMTPMTDLALKDAVKRIRERVKTFENEFASTHQVLMTSAQKIALTWILPEDAHAELEKVQQSARH